jgi:hypothetical protein
MTSHAHVHDVISLEVDLRGTSRAFDDDDIVLGAESIERTRDNGPKFGGPIVISTSIRDMARMPENHDLRGAIALGFEQHGIHVDRDGHARRRGLHRLRAANFSAVIGHCGVVRHVLRFEWRNAVSSAREEAAKRGDERRLPGVGRGSLHHQHARRMPRRFRLYGHARTITGSLAKRKCSPARTCAVGRGG